MEHNNIAKSATILKSNEQQKAPEILLAGVKCSIDKQSSSVIDNCSDLGHILNKSYNFDSMTKKLFNVAAIAVLENTVPIHVSNDCELLIRVSGIEEICNFRSVNLHHKNMITLEESYPIILNTNTVIAGVKGSLDDFYKNLSKALSFLVMDKIKIEKNLPYQNDEEKESFIEQTDNMLNNIFAELDVVPRDVILEDKIAHICIYFPTYQRIFGELLKINIRLEEGINQYSLRLINKFEELKSLENAFCKKTLFDEMATSLTQIPFEQISNGLETDIGTNHQDLIYLQPLVEYTKEHLYPKFDEYINNKCSQSTAYSCELKGDDLFITMLPQLHGEL